MGSSSDGLQGARVGDRQQVGKCGQIQIFIKTLKLTVALWQHVVI